MTDNIVRAIRAIVELGDFSFDAYELPSGEKRVGYAGASTVFGYRDNWLGGLAKKGVKQLEGMKAMGYTGIAKEVEVWGREQGGAGKANTISVRDFTKIATYEGLEKGNKRGIIILASMAEFGIEQTIELAFAGKSTERILAKIQHYTTWTYRELMQAFADNREDANNLRLGNIR